MFKKIILPYTASLGMQLLRSDPAGAERRRSGGGGSLVGEKRGAEELTSEQDSFSALNYQQFQREKTFICARERCALVFRLHKHPLNPHTLLHR